MSGAAFQGEPGGHEADLQSCADLVQAADPDRFLALMAAPVAAREVMLPILAANVEIARAPWVTKEEMIAEMRLQWWRDALEEIAAGKQARRHQVVTPLARVLDATGAGLLDQLCVARRWDIYKDPFEDQADLERFLQDTSGNLLLAGCRALAGDDRIGAEGEAVIRDLGHASGLANFLRAIPALENAQRVPLPDGRPDTVQRLAQAGLERLDKARRNRGRVPRSAAPMLRLGWLAGPVLRRAARDPMAVKAGALAPAEFHRRASLLLRSATGRW